MFYKISDNFFPNIDLSKLDELPTVRAHGKLGRITNPIWLKHNINNGISDSEISFATPLTEILPDFCKEIITKIQEISDSNIIVQSQNIHIIRTIGNVHPHRDPIRKTCMNIGLKSCTAKTTFGLNDSFNDFTSIPTKTIDFTCREGDIYLLNVKSLHSVQQENNIPRYLATVSFSEPYDDILKIFKS